MKIQTQYSKGIKVTVQHHTYLFKEFKNNNFNSAAAFLESIIDEFIKPNLFKRKK